MHVYIVEDDIRAAYALKRRIRLRFPDSTITVVTGNNGEAAYAAFSMLEIGPKSVVITDGLEGLWTDVSRDTRKQGCASCWVYTGEPRLPGLSEAAVRGELTVFEKGQPEINMMSRLGDLQDLWREDVATVDPGLKWRVQDVMSRCHHEWEHNPGTSGFQWFCDHCHISSPQPRDGFCPDRVFEAIAAAFETPTGE
jgi:hypothetical protein